MGARKYRPTHEQAAAMFLAHDKNALDLIFIDSEDSFYFYRDGYYQIQTDRKLKRKIFKFLLKAKADPDRNIAPSFAISPALVDAVYNLLKFYLEEERYYDDPESPYITFTDKKVVDLSAEGLPVVDSSRDLLSFFKIKAEHTILEHDYDPAQAPVFQGFLDQVLVTEEGAEPDKALQAFVQEMFGYLLLPSTKAHCAFFLYGTGSNGKSTLLSLLFKLIPKDFITTQTIQSLTTNPFSLSNLVGKKINIANEEESKYMRSDMFKNLISGEPVTAQRKFGPHFTFTPRAKFIFAMNRIPTFDTIDDAIRRRIHIIPFHAYIPPEQHDKDLPKKLKAELPQILVWALTGARRLIERDYKFIPPEPVKKMMEEFEIEQSTAIAFINDVYEITEQDGDFQSATDIYTDYKDWCEANGRQVMSKQRLLKEIDAKYKHQGVRPDRRRDGGSNATRGRMRLKRKQPRWSGGQKNPI